MIRLAQIGLLIGLVILLVLVAWHYTLIFVSGVVLAALAAAVAIGRM